MLQDKRNLPEDELADMREPIEQQKKRTRVQGSEHQHFESIETALDGQHPPHSTMGYRRTLGRVCDLLSDF